MDLGGAGGAELEGEEGSGVVARGLSDTNEREGEVSGGRGDFS